MFSTFQFKEKYLKHVDQKEGPDVFDKYSEELRSVKNTLEPASDVDQKEEDKKSNNDSAKKILYGKDIVKQLMATKLSKHLDNKTLSELTI